MNFGAQNSRAVLSAGAQALAAGTSSSVVPPTRDGDVPVFDPVIIHNVPGVTNTLPPWSNTIPGSISAILNSSGSFAGHSAVSGFLTCPQASYLKRIGVQRRMAPILDGVLAPLNPLEFGTLIHALLAVRVRWGFEKAHDVLDECLLSKPRLSSVDHLKAFHILKTYDNTFPLRAEPFQYLGVEVEVVACIGFLPSGAPMLRSARYDNLVLVPSISPGVGPSVFSLETKTASRSGGVGQYRSQFVTQVAIFNSSPLRLTYGPMVGVIPNIIVKTEVPRCERLAPHYVSVHESTIALAYLALPEIVHFPLMRDGSYPKFLHACWGKYSPCEFIGLCWENLLGDYEQVVKTPKSITQ